MHCFIRTNPLLAAAIGLLTFVSLARAESQPVKVWEQDVAIPTYAAGEPEPNPMFFFGRASQGAEGRVYPYPLYDSLSNVKADKTYKLVYLENEHVRIGIMPEIGGRLFEAVDKSNNYDFIYRQHVIKPALMIGLIGAWMSGGIEWNIPHHHRATTFLPVQSKIEENADGSKTVWVGELELRHRMRWAVGYTLRPGKSYLECKLRIINRTPVANTMLCFANVAVHANDNYQVIFPPSTQHVTFHGKREFTTWPIATTRFNGADFTSGVDVSWYKNHANAMSMFAWNYEDDFFAGYDHGRQAGIVSVADHHIVPGKKFWTWGNGPRGRMWDKILTDDDGPYIELMVGAYSDNQPDYSWLQPYETKSFEMVWYPLRDIGGVKHANLDAAVNLDLGKDGAAKVGFCTTTAHAAAKVLVKAGDKVLVDETIAVGPAKPYTKQISIPSGIDSHDVRASLSVDGKELVAYSPVRLKSTPMPQPIQGPPTPANIKTVEELYLAGQRIEQFHDPRQEPEPYWEEALKRDSGDSRANTALGIRKLKQARFTEAEQHFRKAIERLGTNYTSPKDGEPSYYLGVALQGQDKPNEAFDAFGKATWSEAWRTPAYFAMSEIAARRGDFSAALGYVDRSLEANALNVRALGLKAAMLRHLGRAKEALAVLSAAADKTDPLDVHLMAERWLAEGKTTSNDLSAALRNHPATALETAAEYGNAGLWKDGAAVLEAMIDGAKDKSRVSPLAYYYLAHFAEAGGDSTKAAEYRDRAIQVSPEYAFPFQSEAIAVLRRAIERNPKDARAPYALGNLLFDGQPDEAVKLWEQSAALDPSFAIVHRNLAAAYSHRDPREGAAKAIAHLEKAVSVREKYALHFAELDELYAAAGTPPDKRLSLLEQNHGVVVKRDDALSREIGLKIFAGKYDEAIRLMTGRKFAVWEGGSLDVAEHWTSAHLLRGQQQLAASKAAAALADFEAAKTIPDNLPSDRRQGGPRNSEIAYWTGLAQEVQGDAASAKKSWQEATEASAAPARRRQQARSSDRQVQVYFQALAKRKLGQLTEAETALRGLTQAAGQSPDRGNDPDEAAPDFGQRTPQRVRTALAHYIAGLGHLGLGEKDKAQSEFESALKSAPDTLGAQVELTRLKSTAGSAQQ